MTEKTVYLMDGDLQLRKRKGSDNWQCSFSITGKGQKRKSLGTSNLTKAKKLAKDIYIAANGRVQRGLSIDGYSFEHVSNEFLQNYERRVARGERTRKDLQNFTGVITRYFIPYFEEHAIDEITEPDIENYKDWRLDYWLTGPGKDIDKITYVRNGHSLHRPAKHEAPSLSRQHQELSILRQIFKFAARKRYLDRRDIPEIKCETVKNNEGAGLTEEEYQKIVRISEQRQFVENPRTMRSREMLWIFVKIAGCTGMRPTELYRMTWGDIENFTPYNLSEINELDEVGMRVTKTIVDDGKKAAFKETVSEQDVIIHARGKGKHRRAVPSAEVSEALSNAYHLWVLENDAKPEATDPVFFNEQGDPIKSFKKGLTNLFESAGLLYDREGRRRTAYCFRHYYITKKLEELTPPYVVAINVGTSVKMIEKTYSHVVPKAFAAYLRK